ncbi:MAG: tetratricopeptide repeat protein [Candidatus Acidiferrales bacterium]
MKLQILLRCSALLLLAALALPAQQAISPAPFHVRYVSQLPYLSQDELQQVISEAQSGDRAAQYWLALIYNGGKLVVKNHDLLGLWLTKSAEQGYAPAQELLQAANSNNAEHDTVKDQMWLLRGAEQGSADSQFWLGVGYEQNLFGTTDLREAAKWYQKAAEQGHPDAQASLGNLYKDGDGVEQNYALAADWYRKAAEHVPDLGGAGQGRYHLAQLYMDGQGVPKDYVQAYMWFSLGPGGTIPEELRSEMTAFQILEAQRVTEIWKSHHREAPNF